MPKTHLTLIQFVLLALFALFSPVACTAPPTTAETITAEEGAALIQNGRVTEIQVAPDWLYLQLDDQTEVRVPRADTPEGGLLAPFHRYDITPADLLDIPVIPHQ